MRGPGAAGSSIPSQLPHPRPGDVGGRGGSKASGKAGGHSQGQRHAVSRARPRLGLKPGGHSQARASGRGCAAEDARSSLTRRRRVCSGRLPRRWDEDTCHGSSQTLATSQRQTQTAPASKATPGTSLPPPPPRPGCLALPALFSLPPQSWSVSWRVLFSGPPPPGRTCRHLPPLRPCTAARPACHQLSVRTGHMHGVARPRSRPLPLGGHFPPMTCLLACCLSLATDVLPGWERGRPRLWQTFHRAFPEAKSTDGNHPSGTDDSASCRRGVTSTLERQLRADRGTEGPTPWPTETQRAREVARGRQGPGGPQSMAPGEDTGGRVSVSAKAVTGWPQPTTRLLQVEVGRHWGQRAPGQQTQALKGPATGRVCTASVPGGTGEPQTPPHPGLHWSGRLPPASSWALGWGSGRVVAKLVL